MSREFNFVNLADMQYLMAGLFIDVKRCADVLDAALTAFNQQSGIPAHIVEWNTKGGNANGPLSFPDRGRFIIELTQGVRPGKRTLWTAAVLEKQGEKEQAPVLFVRMRSPSLDIPMRLEIPLRALINGGPSLKGTYSVYLHVLVADDGTEFVYYGITKRGWNLRFTEHTKAAVAEKSYRLFPRKLNELIQARAAQLTGRIDTRPKLAATISTLVSVGLSKDSAMDAEEYLVEKYSLATKHRVGLNMIPGGRAGIAALRSFSRGKTKVIVDTEERELAADQYLKGHPR